jgi:hypothetical protein
MRPLSFATLILAAVASVVFAEQSAIRLDAIAGLWKYPNRGVWIQINKDGTAFQCRTGRDRLFVSRGKFQSPDSIAWESFWGTERIEFSPGSLTVHHKAGPSGWVPARGPMSPECRKRRDA